MVKINLPNANRKVVVNIKAIKKQHISNLAMDKHKVCKKFGQTCCNLSFRNICKWNELCA